ncbi:hypothetical protein MMC13_005640 [Lambiella insularis]|nr:hypothetical protein [Lambiella insularis]
MASFFSLHRPMSVTAVIPPYSSPSTFSSIFTPRVQQKQRPADVIYTLSVAVNTFEKAATHTEHQQKESQPAPIASNARPLTLDGLRTAVTQASASNAEPNSTSHLDGQPSPTVYINIEEIARKFRPFNPPPAPVPMPAPEESEARLSHALPKPAPAKAVPLSPSFFEAAPTSWASLKEVLKKKLVASGWETFRQRMRNRNLQWQIVRVERRRQMWQAISVKRQRRLKIKKHKYKKLMRRTKNLRRRLDRL